MQQKPLHGENLGNWYTYFSHSMGAFFPIRFPSYGILHHMGNAWFFSSISHSMGKGSKTYQMGKAWEIGYHTVSIVWVCFPLDSHPVAYLIIWEMHVFSHQFPMSWKRQQNPLNGGSLENWLQYFFHSMSAFYH